MGRKKKKFYVVWAGHQPGIYLTWAECKAQTDGFPSTEFKSFKSLEEAQRAKSFDNGL
ncbi:MAG: RNase H1/viroplasmin domain-containing protein [Desulfobacula sp.]|uniref:RNase H1/viroplasmin domain-containing protein n=1 Tax=Desulfobacula sp. TaxID=2593537 RepID=UPI0025C321AC|nr:RNase H1/viroplasmin domain-containing protein [Desulfobacula sp.]MCD4718415.1 RNase H1/viroplasmin domain-containing protein [Desulfobacula sp.]